MIEPLKHILDIYDKKKDTLLYYLTDDVNAVKPWGSFTAMSARILRSKSIPLVLRPLIKAEYVVPLSRHAALILVIQSLRNCLFR